MKVHQGEKMSKHKLVPGSIPRYNMRGSNVDERIAVEASSRPQRSIVVEHEQPPDTPPHIFYKSFDDFSKRVNNLKSLKNWITREMNEGIIFTFPSDQLTLPQYKISVDKKHDFLLHVYYFPLPSDHTLYTQFSGSMKNITISNLITRVQNKKLCEGLAPVSYFTLSRTKLIRLSHNLTSRKRFVGRSVVLFCLTTAICVLSVQEWTSMLGTGKMRKPNAKPSHAS